MKTMNLKELTATYAKLVAKENEIKAEKQALASKIKDGLKEIGASQFGTPKGLFTIYSIANWVFSPKVQRKIEEVELLKEQDKAKGTATPTYSEFIRFTTKKK